MDRFGAAITALLARARHLEAEHCAALRQMRILPQELSWRPDRDEEVWKALWEAFEAFEVYEASADSDAP